MTRILAIVAFSWIGLWLTPAQRGDRLMSQEKFKQAAQTYQDPMRQGTAWYRAGEFEKAVQAFGRINTPEASFNQGNAWMLLGKYDQAVKSFDSALKKRPDWTEAHENRDLAVARGKLVDTKGGDFGDQRIGADQVVFDRDASKDGQTTEVTAEQANSDAAVQAVWLRQVQTKPADFLKSKFAYQRAEQQKESQK
ncbi:tetratricopeptide repeat protein [Thalassoglobus sp.]|uniref:tetratricopeptide repeat protein n=1 Tax=Thalassoglobus sp. TaxID=2795869 RepID=UPI003AA9111E